MAVSVEKYRAAMGRTSTAAWKEYGEAIRAPGAREGYTGESLIDIRQRLRAADPTISAGVERIPGTPGISGAPGTPTSATAPGGDDFMSMYREAIEGLKGGGMALESQLADIEAGKQQARAGGQQALVSSGLAGTTMMGAVPLQAERGAGRARLAARGGAEQMYFQTLASYASLAQRAQEARAEREALMQRLQVSETGAAGRLQTSIAGQESTTATTERAMAKRQKELIAEQQRQQVQQQMQNLIARNREPKTRLQIQPSSPAPFGPSSLVRTPGIRQMGAGQMVPRGSIGGASTAGLASIGMAPGTTLASGGGPAGGPAYMEMFGGGVSEPPGRGDNYSQQFPSLYGEESLLLQPNWVG